MSDVIQTAVMRLFSPEALVAKTRTIELATDNVTWRASLTLRSLTELPVALG